MKNVCENEMKLVGMCLDTGEKERLFFMENGFFHTTFNNAVCERYAFFLGVWLVVAFQYSRYFFYK